MERRGSEVAAAEEGTPLLSDGETTRSGRLSSLRSTTNLRFFHRLSPVPLTLKILLLLLLLLVPLLSFTPLAPFLPPVHHPLKPPLLPAYIARNLGPYAPHEAVAGEYPEVAEGCEAVQAKLLQRHGPRYPTSSAGHRIAASVAKLQQQNATSLSQGQAFVKDYIYDLKADSLTRLAPLFLHQQGREAHSRYSHLSLPFTRTDSSQRVRDSVGNWTEGFYEAADAAGRRRGRKWREAVVISNVPGSNDTLDDNNCPLLPSLRPSTSSLFLSRSPSFASATARLNSAAPGANLTREETLQLMQLCGFESQISEDVGEGEMSAWCGLFEREEEWRAFEYYYDLDKFYGTGYGNPLGPVQGVGYGAELLARLTGDRSWVDNDRTQVNHTLSSSPLTFPLDASLYYDGTHDNLLVAVISLLGLRNGTALSPEREGEGEGEKEEQRRRWRWKTSEVVPFGGKLVVEKVQCAAGERSLQREEGE